MDTSNFFNYPTEEQQGAQQARAFWASRGQRDWRKLLDAMQTLRFRAGETVEQSNGFFIVGLGRFRTRSTTYEEGNALGITTFFGGANSAETIEAVTDGELLTMNHDALETFAAREPELARAVLFDLGRILTFELRNR